MAYESADATDGNAQAEIYQMSLHLHKNLKKKENVRFS